ncbi:fungal-specific transcription factor domain-containing protein [Trichoderma pleuroticola]
MEGKPPKAALAIPRRKRNRIRTSCRPCRARKSKCDGNRPSCLTCLSRGLPDQCVYEQTRPGEHRIASFRSIPHPSPNNTILSGSPVAASNRDSLAGHSAEPKPSGKKWSKNSTAETCIEKKSDSKDAIDRDEDVFGPPSTFSFINRVIATIEPCKSTLTNNSSLSKSFLRDPIGFNVSNAEDVGLDMDDLLLPEKNLADSLIGTYWRYSHPVFPVLHQPGFMNKYETLWKSTESFSRYTGNDILLLATINIVLAIGCQRSEHCPANWRKRDAESLYRRSVHLISAETLDSYSFEVLQLFLLRVIYLQYTPFASRCWSTLGIAQRVAFGLGLDKEAPDSMGQLEREMRRRVWHVSIIMDSIASYTFGWQMNITVPNLVSTPQAIDDEYLQEEGEGSQPVDKPSRLDFFRYYRHMCDVPRDIAANIHLLGQNLGGQRSNSLLTQYISEIPKYCHQLDEFLGNLPSHLQEANEHAVDECFQIQGQILRTRSIYVKLTILRPCLLASVANPSIRSELRKARTGNQNLTMGLLHEVNKLCVTTAQTVIDKVHKNIHIVYRASTWHTLRVTFGSATVLLAASLIPDLGVDLDQEPNKTTWEQAIAIFEFYISYDVSAQGGIQALWDYRQKFEATKRRGEPLLNEIGQAEPQQNPRNGTAAVVSEDAPLNMDNIFFGVDPQGPGVDLSQAFHDWNWLDFDIPEFMLS